MKTEEEILIRQQQFCDSYHFPQGEYTPKMKAWDSAISVSVKTRHYPVYSDKVEKREEAVFFWKTELERIGEKYKKAQQDRYQFQNDVFELQDSINKSPYSECFFKNEIRVGQCQKSLSVFLKWMWCQHELAGIPPVCPIDRQVLSRCYRVMIDTNTGSREEIIDAGAAWSNLTDRGQYIRLVDLTEKVANLENEPRTAVWELFAFQEPK